MKEFHMFIIFLMLASDLIEVRAPGEYFRNLSPASRKILEEADAKRKAREEERRRNVIDAHACLDLWIKAKEAASNVVVDNMEVWKQVCAMRRGSCKIWGPYYSKSLTTMSVFYSVDEDDTGIKFTLKADELEEGSCEKVYPPAPTPPLGSEATHPENSQKDAVPNRGSKMSYTDDSSGSDSKGRKGGRGHAKNGENSRSRSRKHSQGGVTSPTGSDTDDDGITDDSRKAASFHKKRSGSHKKRTHQAETKGTATIVSSTDKIDCLAQWEDAKMYISKGNYPEVLKCICVMKNADCPVDGPFWTGEEGSETVTFEYDSKLQLPFFPCDQRMVRKNCNLFNPAGFQIFEMENIVKVQTVQVRDRKVSDEDQ